MMFQLHDIVHAVSSKTHVPVSELCAPTRGPIYVAEARGLAMYLCRALTEEPTTVIGRFFGRDHSSVIEAARTAQRRMEAMPGVRRVVDEIAREIERDLR